MTMTARMKELWDDWPEMAAYLKRLSQFDAKRYIRTDFLRRFFGIRTPGANMPPEEREIHYEIYLGAIEEIGDLPTFELKRLIAEFIAEDKASWEWQQEKQRRIAAAKAKKRRQRLADHKLKAEISAAANGREAAKIIQGLIEAGVIRYV